jgi:hypothetical protein
VAGLCLALLGCGKSAGVAQTPEAAKETLQKAFAKAPSEVQAIANEAGAAIQNKEDGKAFLQLDELGKRPDLTPEQRGAATLSMLAVGQRLSVAAANGDSDAAALLEHHRANK